VRLLITVSEILLSGENLPPPFSPPGPSPSREAELEALRAIGAIADSSMTYALLQEATARSLEFVAALIGSGTLQASAVGQVELLLIALLGRHQDAKNFRFILAVLSTFVDSQGEVLTASHNAFAESLAQTACDLASRNLQARQSSSISSSRTTVGRSRQSCPGSIWLSRQSSPALHSRRTSEGM
jgi:hypothetical protein